MEIMRPAILIMLFINWTIYSFAQTDCSNEFKTVLKHSTVGKEYSFDRSMPAEYDSLVLIYLGTVKQTKMLY